MVRLRIPVLMMTTALALSLTGCSSSDQPDGYEYTPAWVAESRDEVGGPVVSPDGKTVTVTYWGGKCDEHASASVKDTPSIVSITVEVEASTAPCAALVVKRTLKVALPAPLDDRKLVDGSR